MAGDYLIDFDAAFTARIQQCIDGGRVAGAVWAVEHHRRRIHGGTVGMGCIEDSLPMRPDTLFAFWSGSKPITAMAVLQLFERGQLHILEPVAKYLPAYGSLSVREGDKLVPPRRPLFIRDLLLHSSGIGYGRTEHPCDLELAKLGIGAVLDVRDRKLAEMIDGIATVPLQFHPGEAWAYGLNYDILGRIVEVVSEQSLADYLQTHVFDPLGMVDACFHLNESRRERFALTYGPSDTAVGNGPLQRIDLGVDYFAPPVGQSGGCGVLGTADDLIRFCNCLVHRGRSEDGTQVISPRTADLMLTSQTPTSWLPIDYGPIASDAEAGFGYTLGSLASVVDEAANSRMTRVGDCAWGGFLGLQFILRPSETLVGVLMMQVHPAKADLIEWYFTDMLLASFEVRALARTLHHQK